MLLAAGAPLLFARCDAFTQRDDTAVGPPIHVVGANVGIGKDLPRNGVIQIAFDRFLNPQWVTRQSVALRDEFGGAPDSPIIQYDPVTRVVTLSNPNPGQPWLEADQFYEVLFPSPVEAGDFGLRAIDGATIDPSTGPIGFRVSARLSVLPVPPKIDFCSDVMPIFRTVQLDTSTGKSNQGRCSNGACHGVQQQGVLDTAQGLVLNTEDGIRFTAIGVVANETNTTALAGQPLPPQNNFPVGMPIIDPGNPGDSYLMYKLLRADPTDDPGDAGALPYTACKPTTPPFDYGPGGLAPDDERARLASQVPGRRMPWGNPSLTLDELERVQLWITQGAQVDDCSGCPSTSP